MSAPGARIREDLSRDKNVSEVPGNSPGPCFSKTSINAEKIPRSCSDTARDFKMKNSLDK